MSALQKSSSPAKDTSARVLLPNIGLSKAFASCIGPLKSCEYILLRLCAIGIERCVLADVAGELETALKRAESHSWSDSVGVDKAVTDAVKEVSRTVKIVKGEQPPDKVKSSPWPRRK